MVDAIQVQNQNGEQDPGGLAWPGVFAQKRDRDRRTLRALVTGHGHSPAGQCRPVLNGISLANKCVHVMSACCRERKQEILQDSRVQGAMQRNRQTDDAKLTQHEGAREPVTAGR